MSVNSGTHLLDLIRRWEGNPELHEVGCVELSRAVSRSPDETPELLPGHRKGRPEVGAGNRFTLR